MSLTIQTVPSVKICIPGNPIAAPHSQVLLLCVSKEDTVTGAYVVTGNKERASKVLYMYFSWRGDRWKQRHICELTPTHAQ
jgi:hypothetical protein